MVVSTVVPRPRLQGAHVLLREPIPSDIEDRLKVGRNPEEQIMYGAEPADKDRPLTREDVEGWFNGLAQKPLRWVVEYEGRCVGQARLTMDDPNRRARYAVGIFDGALWDKGLGTEITQLVLKHAFEDLKLHRVDLRVLSFNERAIRCYEKCGFVKEGVEREGALIGGVWHTDIFMSILEHEYFAARS